MKKGPTKIFLYLLLFAILTIAGVFYNQFFKKTYQTGEVLGQTNNLEFFVQPEAGRQPIIEAINSAQKEILVEVYLFSDKEILTALEEAKNRGVAVRVMMEQHPFGGGNINETTANRLQSTGIEFKLTNPTFALTHEKAIVIDGREVFILNQNLTASAFKSNREFDVLDKNPEEAAEAAKIFEADWNRSGYSPQTNNLVISPENSRGKLEALINGATKSLDIEMEIVEDNEMVNVLAERGQQIAVRIIAPDLKKVPSNRPVLQQLKNAGVKVRTLGKPYIHAKLILIDGLRSYTGSINLSTASLDQNRELGILVSQEDIINRERQIFETDWEAASDF